jgi:hypothetical protein
MTDDEISELAECLWDACAEAERDGLIVCPANHHARERGCCPFGAALGKPYPTADEAAASLGLSPDAAVDFTSAFDIGDRSVWASRGMTDLGIRFRAQALSGEGFR